MSITPELYEFIIKVVEDKVKEIKVTREEFDKLTSAVNKLTEKVTELAEAQKKTEERLNQLAVRVDQLAEAQRRTEERLNQLAMRVDQLAEAQRRTEERLNQLAVRVDQLAEAQRRTEETVQKLSEAIRELSVQVGRLSDLIGFGLEDIARVMVPGWLERNMGIYVEDLSPRFIMVDGTELQLNLFGIGRKDAKEIIIVGECKSRIYASEVRKFSKLLKKVHKAFPDKEVLGFLFGFLIHPSAEEEAKKYGIKLIATYMR